MNLRSLQKLHRQIAPVIFLPLLLTAATGFGYRVGRSWFGLSDGFGGRMMSLHEGRFLGAPLVPVYVLLVGLGLLGAIATGIAKMQQRRRAKKTSQGWTPRSIHAVLAPIALLPLLISATTGIAYRLGNTWFTLPDSVRQQLMSLHQGSYFGSVGRVIYIALVGLGLVILLVTGVQMTGIFRRRVKPST